MPTLIDLLDAAVTRYGERPALGLRHDDGTTTTGATASSTDGRASRRGGCARSTSSPATAS